MKLWLLLVLTGCPGEDHPIDAPMTDAAQDAAPDAFVCPMTGYDEPCVPSGGLEPDCAQGCGVCAQAMTGDPMGLCRQVCATELGGCPAGHHAVFIVGPAKCMCEP